MLTFGGPTLRIVAIAGCACCILSGALTGAANAAGAAVGPSTDTNTDASNKKSDQLEEIVVTGTLIPQSRAEISTPVATITDLDIQAKGFANVAEAMQHSTFATGSVQGAQQVNGFTAGASVLSLFGLSPGYTKYLIDGRPLADYPALYNGTDVITNLSGIPTLLVDHIDLLPGGQSSIYGSDAIAGVINIVLKKKIEGLTADARYGWTKDGGGLDKRLEVADGFSFGGVNIVAGAQWEKTQPIWGYQRQITSQFYPNGSSPQRADLDYLADNAVTNQFDFLDPASCANVASQFNNSVAKYSRTSGSYCGSKSAGYYTLNNGTEAVQGYLHASDEFNKHLQVFTDILIDHDTAEYSNGAGFWGTFIDNTYNDFYDPNLQQYMLLQHVFSPEEVGGLNNTLNKNTTNSIRATLGALGNIVGSWTYAVDFTYTENKLTESLKSELSGPIDAFFGTLLGPNLGPDPNGFGVPSYAPNYADFYKPITAAEWNSFTVPLNTYSRTEESLARLQFTNPSLFALPGGEAGLAVVLDGGAQGWDYQPDANFLNGGAYLFTAVSGSGHRSRYSGTTELKLPVVKMLTFDLSARYDDYKVLGENIDKFTYNMGVEFRPFQMLMLRGRYGTAFKAPTLADEFQGQSGFFQFVTDYYKCSTNNPPYTGANIGNCPFAGTQQIFGVTQGSPALKPITAKVYDVGLALTPVDRLLFTADFIGWRIANEISAQPSDQILEQEAACRLGQLDPASPTCVSALSAVTRDPVTGDIAQIFAPKVNVAEENLNVFTATLDYAVSAGRAGEFVFQGSYSDALKHNFTQFAADVQHNLLEDPFFSTEFKSKENFSTTWNFKKFGATAYIERYGRTPNYLAYNFVVGYETPGAGRVSTWTLTNLSARYMVMPGLTLQANVINLFDTQPPVDNSYPGNMNQPYQVQNYNPYGRSYFLEANYKFGAKR